MVVDGSHSVDTRHGTVDCGGLLIAAVEAARFAVLSWAASWLSSKMLASRDSAGVSVFFVGDAPVTHGG